MTITIPIIDNAAMITALTFFVLVIIIRMLRWILSFLP